MKRLFFLCLALLLCACAAAEAYMISLPAGKIIYSGPGYDFAEVQTLDADGVFTITEEIRDNAGNPWGRLKSGAGWIALNMSPYTRPLYAEDPIYEGPGYDYAVADFFAENGTFTIVEEAWDDDANLWGKLKSGAGWVFLKSESALMLAPLRAEYAGDALMHDGEHHRLIIDDSEYAVHMAFFAHETLRGVSFSALELTDAGYAVSEPLFTIAELSPGVPMVVSAAFPGDMSAYALTFTDAVGMPRSFTVTISGMDGSLELIEERS